MIETRSKIKLDEKAFLSVKCKSCSTEQTILLFELELSLQGGCTACRIPFGRDLIEQIEILRNLNFVSDKFDLCLVQTEEE